MTPSVGRIVHYLDKDKTHRPAIITEVEEGEEISVAVFLTHDTEFHASVRHEESKTVAFTWHWPERE